MKATSKDTSSSTSSAHEADLLLAEIRAGRQRLQQFVRLVNELARHDPDTMDSLRAPRPVSRYKCRVASTSVPMPLRSASPKRLALT
jgi:hypothetical protein